MNSKLLFLTCAMLALLGSAPLALADGEAKGKNASASDTSGDDLLKQLSDDSVPMPSGEDVFAANDLAGEFFPEEEDSEEQNVKYVYKGAGSDITLGRPIRDYRVDDGYVQGLMQQRGSE